jgi:Domain of unknown function (DUF1816)
MSFRFQEVTSMAESHKGATTGMGNWLTGMANQLGRAWWVEVTTSNPDCIYYFGPFISAAEAEQAKPGYIEDLMRESAQGVKSTVKRCKPNQLTVCQDNSPPAVRSYSR